VPEVARFRHIHGDVFSEQGVRESLGESAFDVVIAAYGRLRSISEVLKDRVGHLLSIGGAPVYHGFFTRCWQSTSRKRPEARSSTAAMTRS
jgi:hypothetical protein